MGAIQNLKQTRNCFDLPAIKAGTIFERTQQWWLPGSNLPIAEFSYKIGLGTVT